MLFQYFYSDFSDISVQCVEAAGISGRKIYVYFTLLPTQESVKQYLKDRDCEDPDPDKSEDTDDSDKDFD